MSSITADKFYQEPEWIALAVVVVICAIYFLLS